MAAWRSAGMRHRKRWSVGNSSSAVDSMEWSTPDESESTRSGRPAPQPFDRRTPSEPVGARARDDASVACTEDEGGDGQPKPPASPIDERRTIRPSRRAKTGERVKVAVEDRAG